MTLTEHDVGLITTICNFCQVCDGSDDCGGTDEINCTKTTARPPNITTTAITPSPTPTTPCPSDMVRNNTSYCLLRKQILKHNLFVD